MELVGLWEVATGVTAYTSSVKWRRKIHFECIIRVSNSMQRNYSYESSRQSGGQ
jgi:hypothetical protein